MARTDADYDHEIIIVGAGVTGASAAYHLTMQAPGVKDILVIDGGPLPGEGKDGRKSGSAVMDNDKGAPTIKMMVQIFAGNSKQFVSHHGAEGARRYLTATKAGLKLQKQIARSVLDSPEEQMKELGSFYVGREHDEEELKQEYNALKELGVSSCEDLEWYDKERLRQVDGCPPDFVCAIFFPSDAVIDSSSYAKGLLHACEAQGSTRFMNNTTVTRVKECKDTSTAIVELESGSQLIAKHVVVATGGLWQVPELNGILKPCYSYLVHVPCVGSKHACETSSNFFTWGFSHDWCFTRGKVRNSGEDHFSAYKDPKLRERCGNLIRWTLEEYGCEPMASYDDITQQHGVYSETPDNVPLIGSFKDAATDGAGATGSNTICYLLGCNAWGQTVLSYTSSLVPGLLGYKPLTDSQLDCMKLFSIRRFTQLPCATTP